MSERPVLFTLASADRSLSVHPGLTLIQSEDERAALALFDALADTASGAGAPSVYWNRSLPREGNDTSGRQWLASQQALHTGWDTDLAEDLLAALSLSEHVDKPLFMYSLGTARKLNLLAGFASGASITCFETPFGALDGPSRSVVAECLGEAATHPGRAWWIFDFACPDMLAGVDFAAVYQLPV